MGGAQSSPAALLPANVSDLSLWSVPRVTPALPTLVIAEGLVAFLAQEAVERLVREFAEKCTAGSLFAWDFVHRADEVPDVRLVAYRRAAERLGVPYQSSWPADAEQMTAELRRMAPRLSSVRVWRPAEIATEWLGAVETLPFIGFVELFC
jgi:O-methyltransferase involved in polyketide biosynthesis